MKEKLLQIIKRYGVNHQQRKLQEEVFELQESITNYEIAKKSKYSQDFNTLKNNITEEIGDVLNVVEQFLYYYEIDINNVIESKHKKVNRQLKRMEEE